MYILSDEGWKHILQHTFAGVTFVTNKIMTLRTAQFVRDGQCIRRQWQPLLVLTLAWSNMMWLLYIAHTCMRDDADKSIKEEYEFH